MIPEHLKLCDLDNILKLQRIVRDDLEHNNTSHYIVPRSHEYFLSHLHQPHAMVGFKDNAYLAAQAIFHTPEKFNLSNETGLLEIESTELKNVSVLQGVLVHPEYRGRGFMKQFINYWLTWAKQQRISHAMARTEVTHEASKIIFAHAGFRICGIVPDARDNASVHVWIKNLENQ